jgi:hypothetical protein
MCSRPDAPVRHRPWAGRLTVTALTAVASALGGDPPAWARRLLAALPLLSLLLGSDGPGLPSPFDHRASWTRTAGVAVGCEAKAHPLTPRTARRADVRSSAVEGRPR